jgi:hypothetical protein
MELAALQIALTARQPHFVELQFILVMNPNTATESLPLVRPILTTPNVYPKMDLVVLAIVHSSTRPLNAVLLPVAVL